MKTLSFVLLAVIAFCFQSFSASAQPTGPGTFTAAQREIKGTITFAKTMNITPATFIAQTKANLEVTAYTMVNGQLANPQIIANPTIVITNKTVASSPNYTYEYSVKSPNLPLNKPIKVRIKMWCYANCANWDNSVITFKTTPNAYLTATLTNADYVFENYNFKAFKYVVE